MNRQLGKLAAEHDPRIPRLGALLAGPTLAQAPHNLNWYAAEGSWPMLANDRLGDCVPAALLHCVAQRWRYTLGRDEVTFTDPDAIAIYERWGGFDPANPATDQGMILSRTMRQWMRQGIPLPNGKLDKPTAIASLDTNRHDLLDWIRFGIWRMGGVIIGLNCPEAWLSADFILDTPAGSDPGPIAGGHCVYVCGREATARGGELDTISWGQRLRMTEHSLLHCIDEAYVVLDEDWMSAAGHDPAGLDMAAAQRAMQTLLA